MAIPTAKQVIQELLAEVDGKLIEATGEIRAHTHTGRHCGLCSFIKFADSFHARMERVMEEVEWVL